VGSENGTGLADMSRPAAGANGSIAATGGNGLGPAQDNDAVIVPFAHRDIKPANVRQLIVKETELFRTVHPSSWASYQRAKRSVESGVASSFQLYDPYPIYFRSGQGSHMTDVDGNDYVDLCCAFGSLMSGHAHPILQAAIKNQLKDGT